MSHRTLVLLRHAKAENRDGIADLDRPLTVRGHADAMAAGAWLAQSGHVPNLVLCSPARRTRQTWQQVALAFAEASAAAAPDGDIPESSIASGVDPEAARAATDLQVRFEPAIYYGTTEDVLQLIRGVDDTVSVLLLVGHNPTISQLSALLDPTLTDDVDGLQTSTAAVHRLTGSWRDCGPGTASLLTTHTARASGV